MKHTTLFLVGLFASAVAFATGHEAKLDPAGYLYGTVEAKSGNVYTGFLRWGGEEGFWDDHFNGSKSTLPFADERPRGERERRSIRILGVTISFDRDWTSESRQFVARFGDITAIEPRRWGETRVTMKDGSVYEVEDSSNDIGATITVDDAELGRVDLDWEQIERIAFSPAPAASVPAAGRLYGVLVARDARFEGFIQWDLDECMTSDELDGETEDGDLAIEMGRIAAIEKRNSKGAWVELRDGRRLLLEGTNDVDSSTSGIFVEDPRFGRVKVDWDEFERLELESVTTSGRGYAAYEPAAELAGRVIDTDGTKHGGRIVFDLDEAYAWELLSGFRDGIEYHVPFAMIRVIEPLSRDRSRIELVNGEVLELEDSQDVSDKNDGLVVVGGDEGSGRWISWRDTARIELD